MPDQNYTSATQGATVPKNTTHNTTVQVRPDFPTHGDNFTTIARLDTAQDAADFFEALGIYHDMIYCLDLFNAGLAAGKTPDEMRKE